MFGASLLKLRKFGFAFNFFQFFIWSNKTTAKFDDIYPISISPFRINLHGALYPIIKIKTVYVKSNTSHTTSKMKKATTGVAYDHTINVWRGFTSKITEIYFSVKRNFDTQICRIFQKVGTVFTYVTAAASASAA